MIRWIKPLSTHNICQNDNKPKPKQNSIQMTQYNFNWNTRNTTLPFSSISQTKPKLAFVFKTDNHNNNNKFSSFHIQPPCAFWFQCEFSNSLYYLHSEIKQNAKNKRRIWMPLLVSAAICNRKPINSRNLTKVANIRFN